MQYRYIMIVIAVLIVCTGFVSALSISTSTVRTEDDEVQSTTSSGTSAGSQTMNPGEDASEEDEVSEDGEVPEEDEETTLAAYEEELTEEKSTEEDFTGEESTEEEPTEERPTEEESTLEGVTKENICIEGSGNQLIVRFEAGYFERLDGTLDELVMEEIELKIHSSIDAVVLSDLTDFGMPGLQLVSLPEGMSLEDGIAHYESFPQVRFAEPNYQISIYPADNCAENENTDKNTGEELIENNAYELLKENISERLYESSAERFNRTAEIQIDSYSI